MFFGGCCGIRCVTTALGYKTNRACFEFHFSFWILHGIHEMIAISLFDWEAFVQVQSSPFLGDGSHILLVDVL